MVNCFDQFPKTNDFDTVSTHLAFWWGGPPELLKRNRQCQVFGLFGSKDRLQAGIVNFQVAECGQLRALELA